jgi:hypothetical protein
MPWVISMLVLHPRMSTAIDCAAVDVGMSVGISVGGIDVLVGVSEGISVFVRVTGTMAVTPGITVSVKGRVIMIGVAVTMLGVREGTTVQTGNGCGGELKVSHAVSKKTKTTKADIFFMSLLCSCVFAKRIVDSMESKKNQNGLNHKRRYSPIGKHLHL